MMPEVSIKNNLSRLNKLSMVVALQDPMGLMYTNVNTTEFTADLQFAHHITNILVMCLTYNKGKNLNVGKHIFLSATYHNIPKADQPPK
jgi:hypothetical protein